MQGLSSPRALHNSKNSATAVCMRPNSLTLGRRPVFPPPGGANNSPCLHSVCHPHPPHEDSPCPCQQGHGSKRVRCSARALCGLSWCRGWDQGCVRLWSVGVGRGGVLIYAPPPPHPSPHPLQHPTPGSPTPTHENLIPLALMRAPLPLLAPPHGKRGKESPFRHFVRLHGRSGGG